MRLHELDLSIGQKVSLKVVGLDYKQHAFDAQLLGFQKSESVLLTLLSKPGQVLFHKGLKATVNGELTCGRFSFQAEIDAVCETPYLYLHLEYPLNIEFRQLRQFPRIAVDTPVEVKAHTGLGMTTGAICGHMLDVSQGGARLVLEKELTTMVTHLSVGVQLSARDLTRDITVKARVRNRAKTSDLYPHCSFAYGVEFFELGDVEGLFVRCFCLQEQLGGMIIPLEK